MRYHVFISYASEDRATAKKLYADLESEGYKVFLDVHCISPGQKYDDVIMRALESAPCIIVLLSERSIMKGGYIAKEITHALDMEGAQGCSIIPVCLEDCPQPQDRRLSDIQHVCIYPSYDVGLRKILAALALLNVHEEKTDVSEIAIVLLIIMALAASLWGLMRSYF